MNIEDLVDFLEDQDFIFVADEDGLKRMYPPVKYGHYRPQVRNEPEGYPCMIRPEGVADNPYGADDAYLSIVVLPSNYIV